MRKVLLSLFVLIIFSNNIIAINDSNNVVHKSTRIDSIACDALKWEDTIFYSSGIKTLVNPETLDTVYLNLTINHRIVQPQIDSSVCESIIWGGKPHKETFDDTLRLTTTSGCDSLIPIHFSIHKGIKREMIVTADDYFIWADSVFKQDQKSTSFKYKDQNGCSSSVQLKLTIKKKNECDYDDVYHISSNGNMKDTLDAIKTLVEQGKLQKVQNFENIKIQYRDVIKMYEMIDAMVYNQLMLPYRPYTNDLKKLQQIFEQFQELNQSRDTVLDDSFGTKDFVDLLSKYGEYYAEYKTILEKYYKDFKSCKNMHMLEEKIYNQMKKDIQATKYAQCTEYKKRVQYLNEGKPTIPFLNDVTERLLGENKNYEARDFVDIMRAFQILK